jgi:hypothetical protein
MQRKPDCYFYEKCLDYAVSNQKKNLPCQNCQHYESQAKNEKEMAGLLILGAHIILSALSEGQQATFSG